MNREEASERERERGTRKTDRIVVHVIRYLNRRVHIERAAPLRLWSGCCCCYFVVVSGYFCPPHSPVVSIFIALLLSFFSLFAIETEIGARCALRVQNWSIFYSIRLFLSWTERENWLISLESRVIRGVNYIFLLFRSRNSRNDMHTKTGFIYTGKTLDFNQDEIYSDI